MKRYLDKRKLSGKYFKYNILISAICLNVFYLAMILLSCDVRYETNDDEGMASIAYGASTGLYNEHLVFINSIIGLLLKGLLKVFPAIPWYPILMYIGLFLSYCVLTYILLNKNYRWGLWLSVLILFFFGYNTYVTIQFTEVAATMTIAGIALMVHYVNCEEHHLSCLCFLLFLLIFGASYRFEMFCATFLVMSGYGLYFALNIFRKKDIKRVLIAILLVCLAVSICFGMTILSKYEYMNNDLFSDYYTFNAQRAKLTDHGYPDYNENRDVYQKLNISEEDIQLFSFWDFGDPEIYTLQMLTELIKLQKHPTINREFIEGFFKWYPKELLKYQWMPAFLLMLCICVAFDHRNIAWILYELLILSGIQLYFFYTARYLQGRVDIGLFFAATIVLGFIALDTKQHESKSRSYMMGCIFVIVLCAARQQSSHFTTQEMLDKNNAIELSTLLNEDKDNLYLCSTGSAGCYGKAYGIWDVIPPGAQSNIYVLGGWGTYSPYSKAVQNNYNLSNPFRDVVDNSNIYLIDNYHIQATVDYIRRHYDSNAHAILTKEIKDTSIYRVLSKPLYIDTKVVTPNPYNLYQQFNWSVEENRLFVEGYAYLRGVSSYKGSAYILLEDNMGNKSYYQMTQYENDSLSNDFDGKYSSYNICVGIENFNIYNIKIYYQNADKIYCLVDTQA